MPANTLDHRVWAQENFADVVASIASTWLLANPSLDYAAPTGLTVTNGATGVSAAAATAGSNAYRGNITFTVTTGGAGVQATVVFPVPITPTSAGTFLFGQLTARSQLSGAAGASLLQTKVGGNITGFTINTNGTPANGAYSFDYQFMV